MVAFFSGPWPTRVAWAGLPLTVGPALGQALDERSVAVARTGSSMAWVVWAAGLLAVALPTTVSLTALRVAAPSVAAVAGWAAAGGGSAATGVLVTSWAGLLLVVAFAPHTGDCFADGSSYGAERRFLLRPPLVLLLGPVPVAWALAVAGPVAGPLLLAAHRPALAAVVLAVGAPGAAAAVRALHGLSRRWVVLVPNGLVLHDLHTMADPLLMPRTSIARLAPARADDAERALDLTGGAFGLALHIELREPLAVAPRRGRRSLDVVEVSSLRFTPSRPGALLAEAATRRIPVGTLGADAGAPPSHRPR